MGWKSFIIKPFAKYIANDIKNWSSKAVDCQNNIFKELMAAVEKTAFGKDHGLTAITTYEEFKKKVPIREYEQLKTYIERIKKGEENVLWPGKPKYFAKTSGTTSGIKYIPITKESVPNHFNTARNALFNYFIETGNGKWLDKKVIFLSGSPELENINGILTGRLSGISNHMVPNWLKKNQMPSYNTNCIDDWEEKVEKIVEETLSEPMGLISGIPPWVQMYYERLIVRSGKSNIKDIFPDFSVFVYGGVNFEPYRSKLESLVGKKMDSVETYPASEGFIAFQDTQKSNGLLLNSNSGIFFEFVPVDEVFEENPTRLSLNEIEIGVNYALIINNNAGLWGYSIGDTVQFISKFPHRLLVTGRIKHYISAFGEHVISKEVEEAILKVVNSFGEHLVEFTVAPNINPEEGGLPYHEWFIEFDNFHSDKAAFAKQLDAEMILQNIYYQDLIVGNILQPLKIRLMKQDTFRNYMKSQGKLGSQNKVPRLSNDRKIADALKEYIRE
ncbi:MAG: GH3 auxin-responsive promoter family protein [Saprospiraceae bacterium]|nr:GH3 auxin-responsive promoter family protein [Saprospiraceae bacterium]